jgi:serine phosphatase RsbU (regulator of sigma subunit)
MKRLSGLLSCILLLGMAGTLYPQAVVSVSSLDGKVDLGDQRTLHIIRDDDPSYSKPETDDSSWRLSSFPLSPADYEYMGRDENAVFWYRVHVRFSGDFSGREIGLDLGKLADADETYFNGRLIGKSGGFGQPVVHACNKVRLYRISSQDINPDGDNVIAIRVRNTYRADELSGSGRVYLGNFDAMKEAFYFDGFRELIFPVVYLVFFAYFLLLFVNRAKQIENLFYSLFSLGFAVYSFCRTDIKYEIVDNFVFLQKLEFMSMYFAIPMLMAFILSYYHERQRTVHFAFYAFSAVCIVVLIFMRNHVAWYSLNVNFVQYTWVVPLGTMLWVLLKNLRKSLDARIMLASFAVILAGIVHDILLSRGVQLFSFVRVWLTPYSMFLFVVSLASILAIRFASFMNQIEVLNETLEQKVIDRTEKLDQSLKEIKLKDDKIEQELVMAGRVQNSLLPAIARDRKLHLSVLYQPLRQVSGDFYNIIETPEGECMIVIADVSGHGMPAALHAIIAQQAFAKAALEEKSLSGVLRKVNREMGRIDTGHYLTAFLVKFDGSGNLRYANAGHPRGILLNRKDRKIRLLDTPGTVVGIRDDAESLFGDATIPFSEGDCVLLYTDCLVERTNIAGEQFGETRLLESLRRHFYLSFDVMLEHVLEDYHSFVDGSENKDDLTLIAMEYPASDGDTPSTITQREAIRSFA